VIKIWDMNKIELFTTIDAEGGLPVSSLWRVILIELKSYIPLTKNSGLSFSYNSFHPWCEGKPMCSI
jgi:hypothetical protein